MAHLLELLQRGGTDTLRRGVGRTQLGAFFLERQQFAVERIVLAVVDLRPIEDVVEVGVVIQPRTQFDGSRCGR